MMNSNLIKLYHILTIFPCCLIINGAVLPPPWANPKLNPCAIQPNGWQLLYWPPDGKCYRIFKMGYPCPDDMEFSPSPINSGEFSAECRCPPMKAQSASDGKCYELYTRGPCKINHYFAPDTKYNNNQSKRQWGVCLQMKTCPNSNEIFWPKDGKCYQQLTKGPCHKAQLFQLNPSTQIAECTCNNDQLKYYQYSDGLCYQYYTKGPCKEYGHLFLPNRQCGCYENLPYYHQQTQKCFEIGNIGPCNIGESYQLNLLTNHGDCQCKLNYLRYLNSTKCYRQYTQGPCNDNSILINTTTCIEQPCERGYLYYPNNQQCYRIGMKGPCRDGEIFTFDFTTRPSIDGISYNGVCNCGKYHNNQCLYQHNNNNNKDKIVCDRKNGLISYQNHCYKLYQQGPCQKGAWIAPKRHKKQMIDSDNNNNNDGYCECIPGYTKMIRHINNFTEISCIPPTVILANYLNNNSKHLP